MVIGTDFHVGLADEDFERVAIISRGKGNFGGIDAESTPAHGRDFSLSLTLPPLSAVFFKRQG